MTLPPQKYYLLSSVSKIGSVADNCKSFQGMKPQNFHRITKAMYSTITSGINDYGMGMDGPV